MHKKTITRKLLIQEPRRTNEFLLHPQKTITKGLHINYKIDFSLMSGEYAYKDSPASS